MLVLPALVRRHSQFSNLLVIFLMIELASSGGLDWSGSDQKAVAAAGLAVWASCQVERPSRSTSQSLNRRLLTEFGSWLSGLVSFLGISL
jgi:hypothetical protein